jgi:hypothetical protein
MPFATKIPMESQPAEVVAVVMDLLGVARQERYP